MNQSTLGNDIIYQARLNRVIFFWPLVMTFGAVYLWYEAPLPQAKEPSLVIVGVALIWLLMTWVTYHFSSLTIKHRQVILRTGMVVRQTIDIPFNKIESIDIRQSLLGSILRYGALVITGTGGSRNLINYINSPLTCRRHIEQQMHHANLRD